MSEVECADGGWADVGDMPGVTSADAASACWASRLYLVAARCLFLRCVSSSCSESAIRLRLYFWCSLLKFQCGANRAFWLIVFQSLRNARSCVPSCRDHHYFKKVHQILLVRVSTQCLSQVLSLLARSGFGERDRSLPGPEASADAESSLMRWRRLRKCWRRRWHIR